MRFTQGSIGREQRPLHGAALGRSAGLRGSCIAIHETGARHARADRGARQARQSSQTRQTEQTGRAGYG
jgi:hypothetical protein